MVNNDDIVNFIAQTIEVGGLFTVTKDDNKFIMIDGEQVKHKLVDDVEARPLAIYGTMAPNAYIVNPFNEGEASQSITNWYYSTRNITIARVLGKLIMRVLAAGLRSHGKNAKEEEGDALCAKYLGKYAGKVDEKMIKEFESLKGSINEMANIFYNKSLRKCTFNCLIFKQNTRSHYTNIRKGSWEVFEYITKKILGITKDMSEFDYTPDNPNIPVFESFINIYVILLERLEEPAKLIDIDLSNWKTIKQYLLYLDQYYQQAKWCTDSINHMKTLCEGNCANCCNCGKCNQGTQATASDLPPAVANTINRMNSTYNQIPMMNSGMINSDLPPAVRQKITGTPMQYNIQVNNGMVNSDVPPIVRQKMGY